MDRRLIGALIIVAVITASITVSKSAGLRIAGSATRVVFQDDPQIGDCLFLPAGSAGVGSSVNSGTTGASTGIASNGPTISFGQCDGRPKAGEVVALRRVIGADWLRQMQVQGNGDDCRPAGLEYSGLAPHDGRFVLPEQRRDDPVSWQLSIHMESGWLLPSPALQAAGRTWAACVIASPSWTPYTGLVADAYMGGKLPDEFGTCWNSLTVSNAIQPVDCHSAHLAELISAGFIIDPTAVNDGDLRTSCAELAALVLDRPDPTGSGLLVRTHPVQLPVNEKRVVSVLCYVTATQGRELDASLVGIGNKPIPYVG